MRSFVRILVLLFSFTVVAYGQSIPRAGTRFTFALPEGADKASPILTPSQIRLNALSAHDGTGVIWTRDTMISFTFRANQATTIRLPHSLMLLYDLGKSDRGILVRTTQPVNLTLHYILDHAGEATQIWPDEALDTSYLIPGWGLWDDRPYEENNRTQITVVATEDNTTVTVTPTVNCLGGERAGVPSTMVLNRGQCYVLKADSTARALQTMLFGSRVVSDKPVSVLTSTTCAYVPLQNEVACNPLLDHLLPLKNVGTEFLISTPTDIGHKCRVLFISDTSTFFVITAGSTALASNGRAEMVLTRPAQFVTTAPAQCYLLTGGYEYALYGDPTIVSVLPSDRYLADTLMWFSPPILNSYDSAYLVHFVSIVYPTANENQIMVDKDPVTNYPVRPQIGGTSMSAAILQVREGVHTITAPVPVYATAYGFYAADAYSFLIMGKGDRIRIDTPHVDLRTSFADPKTCEVFSGKVYLENGLDASEGVYRIRLTIKYDPNAVDLVSVTPTGMLAGLAVSIDTTTVGTIIANIISTNAPITGSGDMLSLAFYGKQVGQTLLSTQMSGSQLEFVHLEAATANYTDTLQLAETRYRGQVTMSVIAQSGVIGTMEPILVHVFVDEPVSGRYSEVRVRLAYDHDLLGDLQVIDQSTKLVGWAYTQNKIDFETDEFIFTPSGQEVLQGSGTLIRFRLIPYVTRNDTTFIRTSASLTSADPCPLDLDGRPASDLFEGTDICGSPAIRSFLRSLPFEILDVTPNPTNGALDALIRHSLNVGDEMTCSVTDMAGKRLWTTQVSLLSTPETHVFLTLPSWIGEGTYMVTFDAGGYVATRKIVVER